MKNFFNFLKRKEDRLKGCNYVNEDNKSHQDMNENILSSYRKIDPDFIYNHEECDWCSLTKLVYKKLGDWDNESHQDMNESSLSSYCKIDPDFIYNHEECDWHSLVESAYKK